MKVDCFILAESASQVMPTVIMLQNQNVKTNIFLLSKEDINIEGCTTITFEDLYSQMTLFTLTQYIKSPYLFFYTKSTPLKFATNGLRRMLSVAEDTEAGLTYSNYHQIKNGQTLSIPTLDYHIGSARHDFDFGSVLLFKSAIFSTMVTLMPTPFKFAGLYRLIIFIETLSNVIHIDEYLYTEEEEDMRLSGQKQFDYVNPSQQEAQKEFEMAYTMYLSKIEAKLTQNPLKIEFENYSSIEASIVIPVRNRQSTIQTAVLSALNQKCAYTFNVIVVDNHSTDGTTAILKQLAKENTKLIHIIPDETDLQIGGCWNKALQHELCGKFAVQLDSDDLYASTMTLQRIVDKFHEEKCAMVIGSYTITNEKLEPIEPGLIDHKEWTEENGRNNALRINGLGAPRAFYTPIAREIGFPNTSYGEDYAMGLRLSREYKIGRIYESLYLCRRWSGNSDANLSIEQINKNNAYKDSLRKIELVARQKLNKRLAKKPI